MKRRVVITGIGPVTGIGIGKEPFFDNIFKQNTNICEIPPEFEKHYRFKSRFYVPMPQFSLKEFGMEDSIDSITENISKLSILAAKLALTDAGHSISQRNKYLFVDSLSDCTILIGVGMSSLQTALGSYLAHLFGNEQNIMEMYGSNIRYNRMVIPMLMPNSASAWISILYGIKSANYTINASCASGTYAIGEAYRKISDGYYSTAITGGVECLKEKNGAIMRGFDMLAALTRSPDGNPMPFSKKRSGFLLNEGAGCVLILEELEYARRRGARIYAEICGFECNSDAYNIVQMEESAAQIVSLIRRIIGNNKIDYLNSHGTGTLPNDDIESRVIREVFGSRQLQPLINSTKGILGHSIGASGALEAAVTAMSIYKSKVHGNYIEEPIEDINLAAVTTDTEINYALSTSYGFGGHNAAILLKRYGGEHE